MVQCIVKSIPNGGPTELFLVPASANGVTMGGGGGLGGGMVPLIHTWSPPLAPHLTFDCHNKCDGKKSLQCRPLAPPPPQMKVFPFGPSQKKKKTQLCHWPVLYNWCNRNRGMCYPICGMVHIKIFS